MSRLYLITQISILVGSLSSAGLFAIWKLTNFKSSCKQVKNLNRCFFILALLLPLAVSVFSPRFNLPTGMRQPLAESEKILKEPLRVKLPTAQVQKAEAGKGETPFPSVSLSEAFELIALIGALLGIFKLLWNLVSLKRLLSKSHIYKKYRSIRVAVSDETAVPFSLWFFGKRWIVLPQAILQDSSKVSISLKHEMEHHRSHDTLWAFALEFIAPFFYLNPAFLLWKKNILELQEFSCDESLIGRKKVHPRKYGDCLVSVAETALRHRLRLNGVAAMADPKQSKTSLERRITMLMSYKKNRPKSFLITLTGALSVLTLVGASLSLKALASVSSAEPTPGIAVVDSHVQKVAEKYLFEAFKKYHATAGFALVSEAQTGRILAVANIDSDASRPHSPHWALSLRLEPASVMKAIIAAAAIEKGVTEPGEVHDCEKGKLLVGDKEYGDWAAFDKLTTAQTVAQSSNICGIKIGRKLGAEKILEALKVFGFGDPAVSAHFPEARAGALPKIEDLGADQYMARVPSGFGMYLTPLEIVQVFGAMANGGTLYTPIQANEKTARPLRKVLLEETSKKMRTILGSVMTEGTARLSQGKKFVLAGKTGTGYSPWLVERALASKDSQIAHFVGFGPVDAPKYVVYVGIQDPKNNKDHRAHGSSHAAPVFREIIEALLTEKI